PLAGARAAEAPATPGPAEARHGDSAVQTLTVRLRETQGLLTGKDERLRQIEHARDEALEARAAAERRAAQLDHELAQLKAEHAFQLDEHARARAHFEEQLAQARALVNAAGARADDLQRRLAELESEARGRWSAVTRARANWRPSSRRALPASPASSSRRARSQPRWPSATRSCADRSRTRAARRATAPPRRAPRPIPPARARVRRPA